MYTIEMAYAQMRQLQEQASRSRAHQQVVAARRAEKSTKPRNAKKR
ncbi:hypothetical protein [Streptomyces sp. NPDC048603]